MKLLACSTSALAIIAALSAQQAAAAAESSSGSEEVVVTATRRAKSVQDVPLSVSAFTAKNLENLGTESARSLTTPNFIFPTMHTESRAYISVRGIYQEISNVTFEGGFSTYLDGVYLGRNMSFDVDAGDIQRVEILRGPQGTLWGKNTISGAMNIVTAPPDTTESFGNVQVQLGNLNLLRVRSTLNVPLIEGVLAMRVSGQIAKRDGYATYTKFPDTKGSDLGDGIDMQAGRFQLLYTPNERLSFRLAVDTTQSDRGGYPYEEVTPVDGGDTTKFTMTSDRLNREMKDDTGASLTAEYQFESGYTLTSITGVRRTLTAYDVDEDMTPYNVYYSHYHDKQEYFSQEFRIATPVFDSWDAVAGVYYFDQHAANDYHIALGPAFGSFTALYLWEVDTVSVAAFANVNLRLAEGLTLSGGLRYTSEEKDFVGGRYAVPGVPPLGAFIDPPYAAAGLPLHRKADLDEVNYSVSLQYEFNKDVMVYGRVADGFKSGALNQRDGLMVNPEYLTSYEIGLKSQWFDRALTLNAAVFYSDYTDLQVRSVTFANGLPTSALSNAASVTAKGFEIELIGKPTDDLTLNLGIGYVDSTFDKFLTTTTFGAVIDAAGNHVPMTPEWSINGGFWYEHPLDGGGAFLLGGDFSWLDKRYAALDAGQNADFNLLPALTLINARVGYRSQDGKWEVFLWGKNLMDADEPVFRWVLNLGAAAIPSGRSDVERYQEPRTYGVTVKVGF